jgi:hypothetical protein
LLKSATTKTISSRLILSSLNRLNRRRICEWRTHKSLCAANDKFQKNLLRAIRFMLMILVLVVRGRFPVQFEDDAVCCRVVTDIKLVFRSIGWSVRKLFENFEYNYICESMYLYNVRNCRSLLFNLVL